MTNEVMDNVVEETTNLVESEPETTWEESDMVDVTANPSSSILMGIAKKVVRTAVAGGLVAGGCWIANKIRSPKKIIERPVKPIGDVLIGRRPTKK